MIVTCPSCTAKFEIPDDKYRPGRKARCSNCGNVFPLPDVEADGIPHDDIFSTVPSQAAPSFPSPGIPGDDAPEDPAPAGEPSPSPARPLAEDMAPMPDPADNVVIPPPPSPEKKTFKDKFKNRKRLFVIVGAVFVTLLLGYGGSMVYSAFFSPPSGSPDRLTDGRLARSLGGQSGPISEKEAARQATVRRLALGNVRQHTVTDNEKTGPMIVIEGVVANNFDSPRDLVLLEITLYDDQGRALVMREQYCGITLSLLQLRTLSKAALEAALTNQVNILSNNTDIPPGGTVPFTCVFFDLPKAAYEFEVKIADVQDPSRKK